MTGQRQREITEWADAAFGGPWTSNARGDLLAEVDAKMEINRRREWVPDGTGCGRHVKTTGAAT